MADVFISYSRSDKDFVRKLHDALAKLNREMWVDWEGIPLTAEWLKEIYAGIEAADNFIFVISPESVASDACLKEVAHASENNKRLIPVFHRAVPDAAIPESLAKINFIFFRDSDDFESTFATLVETIDTDLQWKHVHSRLLVRAKEWEREGRDKSYLLRGRDLREAEEWQSRGPTKEPKPTSVHSEYILTSRRAEAHRQRLTMGAVVAALLVTIGLAVAALIQRNTARREATIAQARQLSAQAESLRVQGPAFTYPAIGLALESVRREPSPEAGMVLGRSSGSWRLLSEVKVGEEVDVAVFSPDARLLASGAGKAGAVLVSDVTTSKDVASLSLKPFLGLVALEFSPNGRWLAVAGSKDGTVSLWDSTTSKQLASLEHTLPVASLAFSPDSQWLATGGLDGSAKIWHVGSWTNAAQLRHDPPTAAVTVEDIQKAYASWLTGEFQVIAAGPVGFKKPRRHASVLDSLAAHFVTLVAFSRDGQRLATSSDGGTVALWEVGTWKPTARFRHDLAFQGIVMFNPDLKLLAYVRAAEGNAVMVLETGTGRLVSRLQADSRVEKVAFSHDGGRLVTASEDGTAQVWDVLSGKKLTKTTQSYRTALSSKLLSVAFSPDDGRIVTGSEDDTARVWDAVTGRELVALPNHGFVHSVAFSSDGRKLATGSWDGSARVWEPPTAAAQLQGATGYTGIVFSPDRQRLAGAGVTVDQPFVRVWETSTGKEIARFQHASVMHLSFSPDGQWLGSGSLDKSVRVWDLKTGTLVSNKQFDGFVDSPVVFSRDGRWVGSGSWDGTARVWEAATGKDVAQVQHKDRIGMVGVAFSPDGRWLATASYDGTARVTEAATGKMVASLPHGEKLGAVYFSPNGRWLATQPEIPTQYAWLWEAATGRLVAKLENRSKNPFATIFGLQFSPDSRWVAACQDTFARVWDTSTGGQVAQLQHKVPLSLLSFSPDSGRLVTGGDDGTVTVWHVEGEKRIVEFHHSDRINSALFSPDARWVATGSKDGTARVWDPDTGKEMMRADQGEEVTSVAFTGDGRFLAAVGGSVVGLHPLLLEDTVKQTCSYLSRNLSPDEWKLYLPDIPYQRTCPQLP